MRASCDLLVVLSSWSRKLSIVPFGLGRLHKWTAYAAVLGFSNLSLAEAASAAPVGQDLPSTQAGAEPSEPVAGSAPALTADVVQDPMLGSVPAAKRVISSWGEAEALLRSRSTDIRIAVAEAARAEAQSRIALAGALPALTGTAVYTHQFLTNRSSQISRLDAAGNPVFRPLQLPIPDALTGNLQLVQPLLATRTWHAIATAKIGEQSARLSLQELKRTLTRDTASTVVAVITNERIAELNRVGLKNALELLALVRAKSANGEGTSLDVERAKQEVEAARAKVVAGDESLEQARESLGLALGSAEPIGVSRDLNLDAWAKAAQARCRPASQLRQRADIAVLSKQLEIARRNVTDVKHQFVPTVDLRSTLSSTSIDTGAQPRTLWNIQAVLTVPFWEGGARYGNLRLARAEVEQADARLQAGQRAAAIEVNRARRSVSVAHKNAEVAEQSRKTAANIDAMTRKMFDAGLATSLELVVAASALREAEITLALREFDLVRARLDATMVLSRCSW